VGDEPRGHFAPRADFPLHDRSPYSHVRRGSLGFVHRSRTITVAPRQTLNVVDSQHFSVAVYSTAHIPATGCPAPPATRTAAAQTPPPGRPCPAPRASSAALEPRAASRPLPLMHSCPPHRPPCSSRWSTRVPPDPQLVASINHQAIWSRTAVFSVTQETPEDTVSRVRREPVVLGQGTGETVTRP
jgi:hypothetical protein